MYGLVATMYKDVVDIPAEAYSKTSHTFDYYFTRLNIAASLYSLVVASAKCSIIGFQWRIFRLRSLRYGLLMLLATSIAWGIIAVSTQSFVRYT